VQTTLLGLAVAIILALVTALVGPLLVDWGRFRPQVEAEASRLLGTPVRVTGSIEGALLPTPSLTLGGIEIGRSDDTSRLRARSLGVEFSLGALVRGEFRAAEMHLIGPEFSLGLDSAGRLFAPKFAVGFDPDALSIDRLNIEDGHAVLMDFRSGSRLILDKLWFNGDVRSLAGPFKGDGAFVIGGELYPYRVAAGRIGDDGAMKLRLNIDPSGRPVAIDADGTLSFERGEPRFEGAFNVARPAGVVLASGRAVATEPWRLGAKIKAVAASTLLEQVEFQYGPEERAVKLTGTAELKFGTKPRFDGVLSAPQLDLDRMLASPEAPRRLPLAALKVLGDTFSGAWQPSIPARLGIGIDALTLGGATLQAVRGDLITDGDAWNLEGFEFRAPGLTQVNLSGRLDLAKRSGFSGPVGVDSKDPSALVAWLEGVTEALTSQMKPLRARGDVTVGEEKIAVDRLTADIDRKSLEGRVAYSWAADGHPARLDADLSAAELDIDALVAFANAARGGTVFQMPRTGTLGIDVSHATIGGVDARQLSARLRRDAGSLQIERLSVDLGGTRFAASGQIETASGSPRGKIEASVDARDLRGITALALKFAPEATVSLRRFAGRLPATKLNATFTLDGAGTDTAAKLAIEGAGGGIRVSMLGEASRSAAEITSAGLRGFADAAMQWRGKLEADDGAVLVDFLGLDPLVSVDKRPGVLSLSAKGPLASALQVDGHLVAGGLDASVEGTAQFASEGPKADLRLVVATADARPLRQDPAGRTAEPLPMTLRGDLAFANSSLMLSDFTGTLAGTGVRGKLGLDFAQPMRLQGRIEADAVDARSVVAAAAGMQPRSDAGTETTWSAEPFAPGLFQNLTGRVEFKAAQASFTSTLVLRQLQGVATFNRSELALTELDAVLAEGPIKGQLVFNKTAERLMARGQVSLSNADASILLSGDTPSRPVTGRLGAQIQVDGTGLSPASLVGSLAGNGTVTLERAKFAGLDPKVFDVAISLADRMTPDVAKDATKIADTIAAALDNGPLSLPSADGIITIAAGQMRLANTVVHAEGADITMAGNIDLAEGSLNARLTLAAQAGVPASAADRPVINVSLKGALGTPKRTVDVSALAAWLTFRSIEQQSKRLEDIEGRRESLLGETTPPATRPVPDAAPTLPAAINIPSAPGILERGRIPAPVQNGKTAARKPAASKPTGSIPLAPRAPLSISPPN
jgi:large subunit ribosomal protein L24